jgi:hypothetical protein
VLSTSAAAHMRVINVRTVFDVHLHLYQISSLPFSMLLSCSNDLNLKLELVYKRINEDGIQSDPGYIIPSMWKQQSQQLKVYIEKFPPKPWKIISCFFKTCKE